MTRHLIRVVNPCRGEIASVPEFERIVVIFPSEPDVMSESPVPVKNVREVRSDPLSP